VERRGKRDVKLGLREVKSGGDRVEKRVAGRREMAVGKDLGRGGRNIPPDQSRFAISPTASGILNRNDRAGVVKVDGLRRKRKIVGKA